MKQTRIITDDGILCTAKADIQDPLAAQFYSHDPVLVVTHQSGERDTIEWPLCDGGAELLRSALYDARERGIIPDVQSVVLPDGVEFWI